jgi:TP901 family phage tail tape measure protein
MSARKIAITIQVINQQAIQATVAQTTATNNLNAAVQGQTHLQAGLTNSFIKGNLAARAISIGFLAVRDSIRDMTKMGIEFQFTMAKINAIGGESQESNKALEATIRQMATTSMKSAAEIAKVSLEMGKLGLTNAQVKTLIGSVTTLGIALDEDLVTAGETVVQILNTYGKSVTEGKKVSEQLAFTVAASALDLQKFGTAFSYVGGTAAVAGVKFEDLAGAMDYLSNAGIKSSTIGTQLRRIILALSNENSAASAAIGGTVNSLGGLIPALEKLNRVLPKESDKRLASLDSMFGKTATSVAALLLRDTDAVADFSRRTTEATGNLARMGDIMDGSFTAALSRHNNAWREFGMVIGNIAGPIARVFIGLSTLMAKVASFEGERKRWTTTKSVREGGGFGDLRVKDEMNLKAALATLPKLEKEDLAGTEEALSTLEDQLKTLKATFDGMQGNLDIDQLLGKEVDYDFYIKKYEALADSFKKLGASKEVASVLREIKKAEEELFEVRSLGSGDDLKGGKRMLDFQNAVAPDSFEDTNFKNQDKGETFERMKKAGELFDKSTANAIKVSTESMKEYSKSLFEASLNADLLLVSVEGLNGSVSIFSSFLAEGLISEKENPFKGISDAFGDFAKKMVADLIALTIRLLIFKVVLAGLTGGKSLLGGPGGFFSMAFNGSGSGGKDFLLQALGGQKFASGTDQIVRTSTSFIAGDGGPEKVKVTPRSKMGSEDSQPVVFNIAGDVYDYERFARKVKEAQGSNRRNYV